MRLTLEEVEDGDDARGGNVDGELVLPDGELLDVLGHAAHQPRAVAVHVVGLALVLVGWVDNGSLEGADVVAGRHAHILGVLGHGHGALGRRCEGAGSSAIAGGDGLLDGPQR